MGVSVRGVGWRSASHSRSSCCLLLPEPSTDTGLLHWTPSHILRPEIAGFVCAGRVALHCPFALCWPAGGQMHCMSPWWVFWIVPPSEVSWLGWGSRWWAWGSLSSPFAAGVPGGLWSRFLVYTRVSWHARCEVECACGLPASPPLGGSALLSCPRVAPLLGPCCRIVTVLRLAFNPLLPLLLLKLDCVSPHTQ